MNHRQFEDLEQSAYLRGWNDRPKGEFLNGVVVGLPVGLCLAWLIGVVG